MPEQDNRLEIELLKKDVVTMSALLAKIDTTIDKVQEIASSLSKMVSLQEQRIEAQESVQREVQTTLELRRLEHNNDIKEIYSRINTVNSELSGKIEETERTILQELQEIRRELKAEKTSLGSQLKSIEMWKWMVTGGVAIVAWLVAQAINLGKLL